MLWIEERPVKPPPVPVVWLENEITEETDLWDIDAEILMKVRANYAFQAAGSFDESETTAKGGSCS
jgi:hypothetical protein